jgi:hypothetical protein
LLGEPHPWTIGALLGRVLVEAGQQNHGGVGSRFFAFGQTSNWQVGHGRHALLNIR